MTHEERLAAVRARRAKRESAPGLNRDARRRLLRRWIRQGRRCAFCCDFATTVDHIIPLKRGGTNYEGNLAPACLSCNSSRQHLYVMEWRKTSLVQLTLFNVA